MKIVESLFANVSRWLKVEAEAKQVPAAQRANLLANFGAIVLNGLFFPTAGKILGAGLLLTWFLEVFRRFFAVEALLVPATQGLFFFTIFGRREFQLELKALGLLLLSDAAAPFIGNYVWGKLADRCGNHLVIRAAALIALIPPAIAVLLRFMGANFTPGMILALFAAIVFTIGIASVGVDLATKNFLLDLAPDAERPVYLGANDTLVALPTLLLVGGGFAIDRIGYLPVFIVIGCCTAVAAALTATLPREGRA